MWVAKIKIHGSNALLGATMKKSGAFGSGYPIFSNQTKEGLFVYFMGLLSGTEKSKNNFIKNLKQHPRVIKVERNDDFIISQIKESSSFLPVYNPRLLHIEPVTIKEDGTEYWTLGSWNKKDLIGFINSLENVPGAELLKIFQKKITNFSFMRVIPKLTPKQKQAVELAVKSRYYEMPRKIKLEKLAEILGISYSTYQAHLRKAERKLIPYSIDWDI